MGVTSIIHGLSAMLALCIFTSGSEAQTVHVRVELLEVHCGNTEDVTGADEFYVVGALSDGESTKSVLTQPININDNQTKSFVATQRIAFDAKVPIGKTIRGGLIAYDEDYAKDWAKQKEMVNKITDSVSEAARSYDNKDAKKAGWILKLAVAAWDLIASTDKDDELGRIELNVATEGPEEEVKEWKFSRKDITGYSSWDYVVKYRIVRVK